MSANPYEPPETLGHTAVPKWTGAVVLSCLGLLAIVVVGFFVLVILPNTRFSPAGARRYACYQNLKVISIALTNYETNQGAFPPAYTVDEKGNRLHSWRTLILPYMEHRDLYETIDLTKPWDDSANQQAFKAMPNWYRCPSANPASNHTTYLAVVAPDGFFEATHARKLSEILDSAGSTLMLIEVDADQAVPWMSPNDASTEMILAPHGKNKSPHGAGRQAVLGDGRALFLKDDLTGEVLRALISIAGNDNDLANRVVEGIK